MKCTKRICALTLTALMAIIFVACSGNKSEPVPIGNADFQELVKSDATKNLDLSVKIGVIREYSWEPVHTSLESFQEIAQKYVKGDVTLHPELTCQIIYLGGTIVDSKQQCEGMVYSVVRDGILYGSGVVVSDAISRAWAKTWVIGYQSKDSGINWPIWIGFILVMLASPSIFRILAKKNNRY